MHPLPDCAPDRFLTDESLIPCPPAGARALTRLVPLLLLLVGPAVLGCGDDPFSVQDALGVWDLRQINGLEFSGTAPKGVWIRESGGSDSTLVVIESITLEFAAASACSWTVDDGINAAVTEDDCQYAIGQDGDITVGLAGATLEGTAAAGVMTLRDDDTNEWEFGKRR